MRALFCIHGTEERRFQLEIYRVALGISEGTETKRGRRVPFHPIPTPRDKLCASLYRRNPNGRDE